MRRREQWSHLQHLIFAGVGHAQCVVDCDMITGLDADREIATAGLIACKESGFHLGRDRSDVRHGIEAEGAIALVATDAIDLVVDANGKVRLPLCLVPLPWDVRSNGSLRELISVMVELWNAVFETRIKKS